MERGEWEILTFRERADDERGARVISKTAFFFGWFFGFPSLLFFFGWFFPFPSLHIRPGVYHQVVVVQPVQG